MSEEGGTKLQRKPVQQIPQQMSQPQMSQQQMSQQQMSQQQMSQQQMSQPQMSPQQMSPQQSQQNYQQQQSQQNYQQQQMQQLIPNKIKNKRTFSFSWNDKNIKNSVVVIVLFILLNSRMIWKAISRIPMMGSVEPSILALIVNSIIAGIVFYIISTKIN